MDYRNLKIKIFDMYFNIKKIYIQIMQKKICHRIKDKYQANQKLNVIFFAQVPECWNSEKLVYKELQEDDRFNVTIVAIPESKQTYRIKENIFCENNEVYEFLKDEGYDVIDARQNGGHGII